VTDIVDSFDNGVGIDAIIIDFSKVFYLVHDRLVTQLTATGVDSRLVVWVGKFLVGRTQRVRIGGQLSKEVKVSSSMPQGSVLGPLLFVVYVNDIWSNIDWSIGLFADDCMIYKKQITNETNI
jgi:hypothetical protein